MDNPQWSYGLGCIDFERKGTKDNGTAQNCGIQMLNVFLLKKWFVSLSEEFETFCGMACLWNVFQRYFRFVWVSSSKKSCCPVWCSFRVKTRSVLAPHGLEPYAPTRPPNTYRSRQPLWTRMAEFTSLFVSTYYPPASTLGHWVPYGIPHSILVAIGAFGCR